MEDGRRGEAATQITASVTALSCNRLPAAGAPALPAARPSTNTVVPSTTLAGRRCGDRRLGVGERAAEAERRFIVGVDVLLLSVVAPEK